MEEKPSIHEFRQDLVSGEWALLAPGRAKRHGAKLESERRISQPKETCPFEKPEDAGNQPVATYWNVDKSDWRVKIVANKYPAVLPGLITPVRNVGPFSVMDGHGVHEVIIYRDHDKRLHQYTPDELAYFLRIWQERYERLAEQEVGQYVLIFHNDGPRAGATITHPHSQIISTPILPPDVHRSISGSEAFFQKNRRRVFDVMIEWERSEQKRIVFENEHFIVFCPFVSKIPYETRIFPKESSPHFEQTPTDLLPQLGEALYAALNKIAGALDEPDYNFFIHTSPVAYGGHAHEFYTWHIEIGPKIKIDAGFEIGTGIEINPIDPDDAAAEFRAINV